MRLRLPALILAAGLLLAPSATSTAQQTTDDKEQACLKMGYQVIQHAKPLLDKVADSYANSYDRTDAAARACGVYARVVPALRSMRCSAEVVDIMESNFEAMKDGLASLNDKYGSAFHCYVTDGEWGSVQYENVDSFLEQR